MQVWNANNTYGFDRVRWSALKDAATITTVSRYMKYLMQAAGVSAIAVPNGIDESWLDPLEDSAVKPLEAAVRGKMTITKVARWDAEKRWDYAVDSVALMKQMGMSPLFLARGGAPERGTEVMTRMTEKGLSFEKVRWDSSDTESLTKAVLPSIGADVVLLESMLQEQQLKLLYKVSDAVLANSTVEPFGLVGLETMAAGGIAAVGATGEEYATNGYDAISLQTDDVREFVRYVARLKNYGGAQRAMRSEARKSAARYTWRAVIERALFPFIREVGFEVGEDPADGPAISGGAPVNGAVRTNGAAASQPA
jgi:glycosyltransferase involved in cell wall biosynthesis